MAAYADLDGKKRFILYLIYYGRRMEYGGPLYFHLVVSSFFFSSFFLA